MAVPLACRVRGTGGAFMKCERYTNTGRLLAVCVLASPVCQLVRLPARQGVQVAHTPEHII